MSISLVPRHQNFVYALPKESQQYAEEKNTFLRCESERVFWDLNEYKIFKKASRS